MPRIWWPKAFVFSEKDGLGRVRRCRIKYLFWDLIMCSNGWKASDIVAGREKGSSVWDDEQEAWYFSIVDVCNVLADSKDYQTARKYWNKLKENLKKEGNESVKIVTNRKWKLLMVRNTKPM